MKIIRDGNVYELDEFELYDAYRECKHKNFVEDVKTRAEEIEVDLTGKDIDAIANCAENDLNNIDSYWENYWMAIEYAIEQA